MWESFRDLLYRNPNHRITEDLPKAGLMQVFLALDHLHTECKLVHTGNKRFSPGRSSEVANLYPDRH